MTFESQMDQCELAESHWAQDIQSVLLSSTKGCQGSAQGNCSSSSPSQKMTSSKKKKVPFVAGPKLELKSPSCWVGQMSVFFQNVRLMTRHPGTTNQPEGEG